MGEVVDPDKQNYSIPLYEFSGSSHAVKSINFVALSRDIQNTKRKLSLSINRISYKPLRLIGCCEHQWFSQKMTIKGHNFLVFPKMSSPKIATERHGLTLKFVPRCPRIKFRLIILFLSVC